MSWLPQAVHPTQVGSIGTTWTEVGGGAIALNAGEGIYITVKRDSSGTTDGAEIAIIGSADGTNYADEENADMTFLVPISPEPGYKGVFFSGPPYIKIMAKSAGSTDTQTIDIWYNTDGVDAG